MSSNDIRHDVEVMKMTRAKLERLRRQLADGKHFIANEKAAAQRGEPVFTGNRKERRGRRAEFRSHAKATKSGPTPTSSE